MSSITLEKPTFIELFAGIGGFRYGLEKAGWKCVWANELNKHACNVYRKHYGTNELFEGDIKNVETKTIPNHDMLVAGFPCQAFSCAGKRQGFKDERGTLFTHIARIAEAKRPKLLFLENVEALIQHDSGRTFAVILRTLGGLGYLLEWQVLDSYTFGIPQQRTRTYIVGHLGGECARTIFPFTTPNRLPQKSREDKRFSNFCGKWTTKKGFAGTILANYDKQSGNSTKIIDNGKPRIFTFKELERLQGFPDDWTEGFTDEQRRTMIGNAVSTPVIYSISQALRSCIV